ncbi:MAG: hypothetical protein LQ350_007691 [Teloschistes chrysophthalmus]|nr:MAG: hypothetical protein LQ350_007691 [Niorma chrysophthalma]
MEDEVTLPYKLDWMAIHRVSDDYVKGRNSSSHADRLFFKVLHRRDRLRYSARTGVTERTDRVVSVLRVKKHSLGFHIIELSNLDREIPVFRDANGLRTLMNTVAAHFNDPIPRRTTNYYKEISVERDGVDLGTLHDIRLRFTLWDDLVQSYYERTERRWARREFKGRKSHLPVVLLKKGGY